MLQIGLTSSLFGVVVILILLDSIAFFVLAKLVFFCLFFIRRSCILSPTCSKIVFQIDARLQSYLWNRWGGRLAHKKKKNTWKFIATTKV